MIKQISYVFIFVLTLIQVACRHKDLCYEQADMVDVSIYFNWEKAPDASPKSMVVFVYPKGKKEPIRFDIVGCEKGIVRLPEGEYHAFCFNTDTRNIIYTNKHEYERFEITTKRTYLLRGMNVMLPSNVEPPRVEGFDQEVIILPPDVLWGDVQNDIIINLSENKKEIVFYPEVRVTKYTIDILNVDNLKKNTLVSASLSTLPRSLYPKAFINSEDSVTIPFELKAYAEEKQIKGIFHSFGCLPGLKCAHRLFVYTILDDCTVWHHSFDVTDQIHSSPNPRDIHIVIEHLPLPPTSITEGGFLPNVEDWKEIEEDIVF